MSTEKPQQDANATQGAHTDWPKTLEWIERQAQESLKARFATAEILAKEAQTTLSVLLAGVAGSAAYAAKIFEAGPLGSVTIAWVAVSIYLTVLCNLLIHLCMKFDSFPALWQDPKNLMQPSYSLDSLREAEVKNIGERIADATKLNAIRAKRLNRIRTAAALSPLIFIFFQIFVMNYSNLIV